MSIQIVILGFGYANRVSKFKIKLTCDIDELEDLQREFSR